MKKLLLMIVLLAASLLLVACADPYDIENLNDRNIVEMSSEDVQALLTAVDWDQVGEAASLTINADVNVKTHQEISFSSMSYEYDYEISAIFSSTTYVLDNENVEDAAAHSESEFEFTYTNTSIVNTVETTVESSGSGTLNAYLFIGHAYVNPEVTLTTGGTDTTISGKEKMNEPISQSVWDDLRREETVDSVIDGGISGVYSAPEAIEELLDWENLAEFMDAFPAITVYQNGSVTTVHFEVNKALILEHIEDLLEFYNDKMADMGEEVATAAEIAEAVSEVEGYMDYFDTLSMTMDVVLDDGILVRQGISLDLESNSGLFDEEGLELDISFSILVDYGVDMPNFPNDLDEYTGVDEIGNNWDLGNIMG